MGISNKLIFPFYVKCCDDKNTLNNIIHNLDSKNKIACIGEQSHNTNPIIEKIYKKKPNMNFFDILNKDESINNKNKKFYFDINNEWEQIKNYDLVTFLRVCMYVENKDKFFFNLQNCIKNNKHILIDFNLLMRKSINNYSFDLEKLFLKMSLIKSTENIYI